MKFRFATAIAAVAVMGVACGSGASGAARGGQATHTSTSATARAEGASTGAGSTSADAKTAASAGAQTRAPQPVATPTGYPQYVQGTIPAPISYTVAVKCVHQGLAQTLTIRTTPGYYVAFDTQYADGKDGQKEGGMGYTVMPQSGFWTQSWMVSPQAASGKATIFISVEGGHPVETGFRQPTFQVGTC